MTFRQRWNLLTVAIDKKRKQALNERQALAIEGYVQTSLMLL